MFECPRSAFLPPPRTPMLPSSSISIAMARMFCEPFECWVQPSAYMDVIVLVGDDVSAGQVCGEIESTKSVGELYAPVSGEVLAVNDEAAEEPSLVNSDAYGAGWLMRVRVGEGALDGLMDRDAYVAFAGEA